MEPEAPRAQVEQTTVKLECEEVIDIPSNESEFVEDDSESSASSSDDAGKSSIPVGS